MQQTVSPAPPPTRHDLARADEQLAARELLLQRDAFRGRLIELVGLAVTADAAGPDTSASERYWSRVDDLERDVDSLFSTGELHAAARHWASHGIGSPVPDVMTFVPGLTGARVRTLSTTTVLVALRSIEFRCGGMPCAEADTQTDAEFGFEGATALYRRRLRNRLRRPT